MLDPAVVLRSAGGVARADATVLVDGAHAVASRALTFKRLSPFVRPALVNGAAGVVVVRIAVLGLGEGITIRAPFTAPKPSPKC